MEDYTFEEIDEIFKNLYVENDCQEIWEEYLIYKEENEECYHIDFLINFYSEFFKKLETLMGL